MDTVYDLYFNICSVFGFPNLQSMKTGLLVCLGVIILAMGAIAGFQAVAIFELKRQIARGEECSDTTLPDSVLLLNRPYIVDLGDSVTDKIIRFTEDFEGDAAFYVIMDQEGGIIPIKRNTIYSNERMTPLFKIISKCE